MGKKLHEMTQEEIKDILDDSSKTATFVSEAFTTFDKDGSGFIDKEELKNYIVAAYPTIADTDEKRDAVFAEFDTNGDGKLSHDEFAVLVTKFMHHLLGA